jgi:hypothetical protein
MSLSGETLARRFLSEVPVKLLTVFAPAGPTYLCHNDEDVTSRGQVYSAIGMDINWPAKGNEPPSVTIRVPVVANAMVNLIETLDSPVKMRLETVFASNPDTVLTVTEGLELTGLSLNAAAFTAQVTRWMPLREPVPSIRATQGLFPGVFFGR